jgi:hypothetical protein
MPRTVLRFPLLNTWQLEGDWLVNPKDVLFHLPIHSRDNHQLASDHVPIARQVSSYCCDPSKGRALDVLANESLEYSKEHFATYDSTPASHEQMYLRECLRENNNDMRQ